ncbi:hypothetical protein BN1708_003538 [Verticillium longisporum]|uniref:Rab proteins geranylgeranyltransferase n=1 Tax=Verticillium longisporum TaxID=100787 RepID=A0A0G4LIV0_VERLO|nr:hypothetical protein BN1708_003538 [Verticillium longisporum]
MESLAETVWDVVICGTGLQQSLLALALSRSGKQILHLDPNEYYGGNEAALTLQEAEAWIEQLQKQQPAAEAPIFSSASASRQAEAGSPLSFSRAYSLALAPFIIHTRSTLLSQLVSSRAHRQLEFLAVGAFHVYRPGDDSSGGVPLLTPIPSTREAIFASTAIQPRPKRALMKFLRFVLDHDAPAQQEKWQSRADDPLAAFLEDEFKLDAELRTLILALTLSLDGAIKVQDGLVAIERHLTSMGMFGPGFAAVYPKWGGGSEIAQVGCRACAVGGGVYMLGTGVKSTRPLQADEDGAQFEVALGTGDVKVKTKMLIRSDHATAAEGRDTRVARLVAVINSPLASLFEPIMEGGPNPAVAVIAMPAGSVNDSDGQPAQYPVYIFAHSSETGECPSGQSVLYFTTLAAINASAILDCALSSLLAAFSGPEAAQELSSIYQLRYEQAHSSQSSTTDEEGLVLLPTLPLDLAFTDSTLKPVEAAWAKIMASAAGPDGPVEYMKFEDREGVGEDED